MRCPKMILMLSLTISAILPVQSARADKVRFCFLFCEVEVSPGSDSFCQSYQPVVRTPADSATVKGARGPVQSRVVKNDVLYKCTCQGWKNPVCKNL